MKLLWGVNHDQHGRAPKQFAVVAVAALALNLAVVAPQFAPKAEAAFPGRNGRIALPVLQAPFSVAPPIFGEFFCPVFDRDLFTVSPSGGGLRQLTSGIDSDLLPSWSPDGQKVAFTRLDVTFGKVRPGDIYVINADGTGERNLTNTPLIFEIAASWSPDGKRIVFSSDRVFPDLNHRVCLRGGERDLYVMDADGGNLVRLTVDPGSEIAPEWSPDGKWIAYNGTPNQVLLIRPDGTGKRELPVAANYPGWSPDGKTIIFNSGEGDEGIATIRRDGSGLEFLTRDHPGVNLFGTFSPDGEWIAFVSDRDGVWQLFKMRADGSNVEKIIDLDLNPALAEPSWGPRP